ncbi:hypothetical protein F5X99DRAFT_354384 [Biscogniauxia marginata]|nr:hypothetical protein F5X99DRAFT_354384 [Biscogniauxia marginata]
MAIGIPLRVKSLLRPKLEKRRSKRFTARCQDPSEVEIEQTTIIEAPSDFNEQQNSLFFQKLPIEVRKMIYSFVWRGTYDHMYHVPNGRHLYFKDGHWVNMRCVMSEADEDPDLIQKNMDFVYNSGQGDLLLWQRRLASTWGSRHWRCEERIKYGRTGAIDRTNIGCMMMVCKRMHPEVMESVFESHNFIFNDLFSAHNFFVCIPSPYLFHLRYLDLTLNVPFHECSPFVINMPKNRVKAVLDSIKLLPYLHSLRVSLDVCDRGPWRKLPERDLVTHLKSCKAFREFTVELPPPLAVKAHLLDGQDLDNSQKDTPFCIVRRPPLRYWQFNPGDVEHFRWETFKRSNQSHCRITVTKSRMAISNPYQMNLDGQ